MRRRARAEPGGAPFGAVVALTFALVAGSALIAIPPVIVNTDPTIVPGGTATQKQNAETFLYLLVFAVFLPFWILAAPRLADRIQSGPNGAGLQPLAAILLILLGVAIAGVRVSGELPWGSGLATMQVAALVWAAVAFLALFRATRDTRWTALTRLSDRAAAIWWIAGAMFIAGALAVTRFGHLDLPALVLGLALLGLVVWEYGRFSPDPLPRAWRRVLDAAIVVLILLAIPDMVILPVERAATDPDAGLLVYVISFHQALYLGAASQVLGGSTLLVDTVSQYGIAPIYVLAGLFKLIPIGNGTLGFIDAALSAGVFATGFAILRMAGVRIGMAAVAMVVAVIALVYGLTYPIGGLLQHGALRFGLPVLVIAPTVAGFRWPGISRWANLLALAVVGLSSIWALEAFLYVTFSYLGMAAIQVPWQARGRRIRWFARCVVKMVAAWVVTGIAFALLTLAASGSLPEWGLYLSYLRDFLAGDVGDLTYDFPAWSSAFGLAAVYLASTIGLAGLVGRLPEYAAARKTAMVALAGLTAYGIALFSYFDNRSLDHVLPYVSLPAVLLVTIWLTLLLEPESRASIAVRRFGLGAVCLVAVLMVSVAWPAAGNRASDSLLAYALPGGKSLSHGFDRLWDPPEFVAGAADGERLVEQHMAGQDEIAVVTRPDLDVEIVTRTQKPNALAITDAKEMSWVSQPHIEHVEEAADRLGPGDLMLVDEPGLEAFRYVEQNPQDGPEYPGLASPIEEIQRIALGRIAQDYRLKTVATGPSGLSVVRLESR